MFVNEGTAKMTMTLRIKKVYFDQILSGEKTIEYRDVKPFYVRIFSNHEIKQLKLHYQSSRQMTVEVVKITQIKTPRFLLDTGIPFSSKVFEIKLTNPKLIRG